MAAICARAREGRARTQFWRTAIAEMKLWRGQRLHMGASKKQRAWAWYLGAFAGRVCSRGWRDV
eukprot:14330326-Alexandrium_andersonii.AAC.1